MPPKESHPAVIDFYSSDKISWQIPGRKDCVSVIKDGNKVQVLKKIMLSTVREAFEVFKEEKPDVKMGKSTFARTCPTSLPFKRKGIS